ncbi:MAG: hypothetical protein CMP65_05215 [Flavobacteriales bacterium]|nr:hypothetical protein [Flavobacteriales bacterium]
MILFFLIVPFFLVSQVFTIDDDYLEFSDNYMVNNFSMNTFLNTFSDLTITYEIINDSLPSGWDFQNCFPTCNPINTYIGPATFFSNGTSVYLNGHFYPNNTPGVGLLVMELSAQHGLYRDTVTWRGEALMEMDINEILYSNSSIDKIYNYNGQIVKDFHFGNIFFVTFKDNSTKTYYIIR